MLDFFTVSTRSAKKGTVEVYPKFIIKRSKDLMIRGGDFYAVWLEEKGLWSTDEQDVIQLVDRALDDFAREHEAAMDGAVKVLHLWDAATGMIDIWHKYCQKQMRDNYAMLDERIVFANEETTKKDYASHKLGYPLEEGEPESWSRLVGTLYSPEERRKIEWCVGAIVDGASTKLQKFAVLYGAAGTGKSTVLGIIQQLFDGYTSVFDAKALGSASNAFALEAFRSNPLVAIQHDGDLSRIEDNTRLNSLVSHELMTVNEKFKATYSNRFKAFLWMGTNKPVKITDAKSGLIRRLIDISPTGNKLPSAEYRALMQRIPFELGKIAWHCREVFRADTGAYDDYIPLEMLGASNDFFNFVEDSWSIFKQDDHTTLRAAWEMYKTYCDDAKVAFPYSQRAFKEELKNYFREYQERVSLPDGTRQRNLYSGFRADRFEIGKADTEAPKAASALPEWLRLKRQPSKLDISAAACPAQYASEDETPLKRWANVSTRLTDISTDRLHYVKVPENLVVIDFDLKGSDGKKSRERNLAEAAKWPPTYAELSKGGQGLHLHYWYNGDVAKLSRIFSDDVEVKVFAGNSSLRRRLSECNDLDVMVISSGLPLKEESKTVNFEGIRNEKGLRTVIRRNLLKEYHGATKPSVDFIKKVLDDAYISGVSYDVSDLKPAVIAFAANSTHQADICLKNTMLMHFQSKDHEDAAPVNYDADGAIVFYDVEVFPNLFLVNWKELGEDKPVARMINPTPRDIERLLSYRLVGFNCRRYDNHILYGRLLGYTNEQLYRLSQKIVTGAKDCFFGEAYNLSYTDVYDFSSKKQSLKKFEIELGIHHQELGLPWDQPVPEELWAKVAEYCDNDVLATEAVWNARQSDFLAREILAAVAGMTVNDTTNSLTTRIIFGKERKPQGAFKYRNLAEPVRP